MKNDPIPSAAASDELRVLTTMKSLREGEFIDELNDALQEAIDTSTELGKPAVVVVKLHITPAGRTVVVDDEIKTTLPKAPQDGTIFFLDKGNALSRKDPKQETFPAEVGFKGGAAPAVNE